MRTHLIFDLETLITPNCIKYKSKNNNKQDHYKIKHGVEKFLFSLSLLDCKFVYLVSNFTPQELTDILQLTGLDYFFEFINSNSKLDDSFWENYFKSIELNPEHSILYTASLQTALFASKIDKLKIIIVNSNITDSNFKCINNFTEISSNTAQTDLKYVTEVTT